MTLSRSTARVFTGTLSNLVLGDGIATALLTHTLRERVRNTPITIPGAVIGRIENLSEGQVSLYGELKDGTLTVLGPDLRRRTLAAARPRGEMGPPAPQTVEGVLSDVSFLTARTTGKLYVKGTFEFATEEGTVTVPALVRSPLAETIGGDITDGVTTLRGVLLGDTFEVLGLVVPEAPAVPVKRALSRAQKDARNARARERRVEKKQQANA